LAKATPPHYDPPPHGFPSSTFFTASSARRAAITSLLLTSPLGHALIIIGYMLLMEIKGGFSGLRNISPTGAILIYTDRVGIACSTNCPGRSPGLFISDCECAPRFRPCPNCGTAVAFVNVLNTITVPAISHTGFMFI
jgi:hypothetical protein